MDSFNKPSDVDLIWINSWEKTLKHFLAVCFLKFRLFTKGIWWTYLLFQVQKLTVKDNNDPDLIFEIEKQKKRKNNNEVNPSINNKHTNGPNKTLNRFLSKVVYQCSYMTVLVKVLKAVDFFTETIVNMNNQI